MLSTLDMQHLQNVIMTKPGTDNAMRHLCLLAQPTSQVHRQRDKWMQTSMNVMYSL
jgi:hypothetical protein